MAEGAQRDDEGGNGVRLLTPALAAVLAAALFLAGCASARPAPPRPITLHGTMQVTDAEANSCDYASDDDEDFTDIGQGTQVTVTIGQKVVAAGDLDAPARKDPTSSGVCQFNFTVPGIPPGHALYGVQVAKRGTLYFSQPKMRQEVGMSLGS